MSGGEVSREKVLGKLKDYLEHKITHSELVSWAESVMQEGTFSEGEHDLLRDIVAHIGLSDVRAFGLTWEDYEDMVKQLGCVLHVKIVPA